MIDLHMHSTFSDGSFTPEQLVKKSKDIGLSAIALTDHDTVDGVKIFLTECKKQNITGLSATEISADVKKGTMHMLGYFLDLQNEQLINSLAKIRFGRSERNKVILKKLNALGLDITMEEIQDYAGEDNIGRLHFAQAMTSRGYVHNKEQAFDKYLAKGKKAYADRFRLTPAEAIKVIREAGGLPVLAHPFTLELDQNALTELLKELKDIGLAGIEAYYSKFSKQQHRLYLDLAKRFDLAITGGSDFHGEGIPDIQIGIGTGNLKIPDSVLEQLNERRAE
jgi:3',5'-nucleoside bisphosphate phosphatase